MFLEQYMYDANKQPKQKRNLEELYCYWNNKLFERVIRIFKWNELPFNQRELEFILAIDGYAGIVKDDNVIYCARGGMSGVTEYPDIFKFFTYSTPVHKSHIKEIDKNCVIVDSCATRNPIIDLVNYYALLLAHNDISIVACMVNMRSEQIFACDTDNDASDVKSYYKNLYNGELSVLVTSTMAEVVKNVTVPTHKTGQLSELVETREKLLRSFYHDIGIRSTADKKERMIIDEVTNDSSLLLFNISDMLNERKKACDKIKEVFNLSVSVELSEEYKYILGGDEQNDNI